MSSSYNLPRPEFHAPSLLTGSTQLFKVRISHYSSLHGYNLNTHLFTARISQFISSRLESHYLPLHDQNRELPIYPLFKEEGASIPLPLFSSHRSETLFFSSLLNSSPEILSVITHLHTVRVSRYSSVHGQNLTTPLFTARISILISSRLESKYSSFHDQNLATHLFTARISIPISSRLESQYPSLQNLTTHLSLLHKSTFLKRKEPLFHFPYFSSHRSKPLFFSPLPNSSPKIRLEIATGNFSRAKRSQNTPTGHTATV